MALFCPRQSVEFRPAFLLVMPNTHSKHRCQRVSRLCDVSDVKTAGIIPMESNRQTSPRIKGRHLKENCCSPRWRSIIFAVYSILPGHLREVAFQPMLRPFCSAPARFAEPTADNGTDQGRFPSPFQSSCRSRCWPVRRPAYWQTASSFCPSQRA